MLGGNAYLYGRQSAEFHVQVEVVSLEHTDYFPAQVQLEGRLVRIFRDRKNRLAIGDIIIFPVDVTEEGAYIPTGATLWTYYKNIKSARYLEVFLDGEPPQLEIATWQSAVIPSPSEKP